MRIMSALGEQRPGGEDELVLVFRPPENPAAQVAVETPFRGHRVRLDELLDWFKALRVDSIELWIEGARTSGSKTELFLSTEGKTGAKITLKPHPEGVGVSRELSLDQVVRSSPSNTPGEPLGNAVNFSAKQVQTVAVASESPVTAFFSPKGGIEQQILMSIGGAVATIEMAAYAFTNENIAKALLDAINRGVKVALVMDRSETKGPQASLHDELEKAGTAIRLISPPGGIMHDKFIIIDGKNVEWGSYNYTGRAEDMNFENATFLSNGNLAQKYHSDFVSIYNQATPEAQGLKRPLRRFLRKLRSRFKPRG
jgi:phosphatidylserine/phosphatidylglycerophosphate/cardiolipin synthase-like enzyme